MGQQVFTNAVVNKDLKSQITDGFLNALFNFYVSGYYLDLNEGRYYAIGQEKDYNDLYGASDSWSLFDDYIREYIHEDDKELLTKVSRIEYIREQLKIEKNYSVEIRDFATGKERWLRYTTMRGADEDHAAISFIDVTEQVLQIQTIKELNEELAQKQNALEDLSAEQEAQLEEIIALNDELMSKQNRLEKATEEAQAANAAKTSFLFNMSHDIRTPMNAIIGFTELLEKYIDDKERVKSYLKKIRGANEFLLSLINNVLEMARIESGNVFLEEKMQKTGIVYRELQSVFDERMQAKNITFTCSSNVKHPYLAYDKVKIYEILLNLISNAYKYTPEGGRVDFSMRELPCDKKGYVLIEAKVSDTGIGMTEDFLPHIFDEFTRETSTSDKKIEGTGLGMPIVKKLVDLMNGTITVESALGKGTTFTVTIPHKMGTADMVEGEEETQVDFTPQVGKRILLAEDNELNAEIAMEILGENGAGYQIEWAENGQICVDMLAKADDGYYDVILMDIMMPLMDGFTASKEIREMENPAKRNIPIVAMTANAFEEDKEKVLSAGMNAHTSKPIDIGKLMNVLARVLN